MNIKKKVTLFFIAVFTLLSLSFAISHPSYAATSLLNESFTGSSTIPGQWMYGGNNICLTAGSSSTPAGSVPACNSTAIDTPGNGVLRLTGDNYGSNGFVILNTPLNSHQGFSISFDMYQYGLDATQADGIGFMLLDGSVSPTNAGGDGGSLGYGFNRIRTDTNTEEYWGIDGGYAGVGFDAYGSYSITSCPGAGWSGCSPQTPNGIGIRGSQQAHYKMVQSVVASHALSVVTNVRNDARRTVTISVSPTQIMTVVIDYHDGNGPITELSGIDLKTINGTNAYPDTLKIGFSGSTGGVKGYHEIRNLGIETLDPSLHIDLASDKQSVNPGDSISFAATVSNDSGAAPTLDTISSTITLPDGIVPQTASGNGWICSVNGQIVSCSRPGSGTSALQPGSSAPVITIAARVLSSATLGTKSLSASTNTTANVGSSSTTMDVSVVAPTVQPSVPSAPNTGSANPVQLFAISTFILVLSAVVAIAWRSVRRAR